MEKQKATKRRLIGIVTSDKMAKTLVVKVEDIRVHPKYLKRYKVFKKYSVHNELPDIKIKDRVMIEESRPISKTKSWVVIEKVNK